MASQRHGTLYVGVPSDLVKRVSQHRTSASDAFTRSYGCTLLVYYELHSDMTTAITREKQIKAGSRTKKLALIETDNPQWHDHYPEIV